MNKSLHELSLREYGASRGSHSHEHAQVLVGLDGLLELEVEGHARRVAAGEGLLVAPGERHDFEAKGGSRCLVLDTDDRAWLRCGTTPFCSAEVSALSRWLWLAWKHRGAIHPVVPHLLLEAWQPPAGSSRPRRAVDWSQLSSWVARNLHRDLTVADLASRVHLSASRFSDRCLEANGMSAMAWLRMQRLARARSLRAAGVAVGETARRCGYRSPSALTAALRRSSRDD